MWPKKAVQNRRTFDQANINAGKCIIGMQYGTNKMASQAGLSFGKSRGISDHEMTGPSSDIDPSKAVIGLQYGTNKMANQSGMSFGRPRGINDHEMKGTLF